MNWRKSWPIHPYAFAFLPVLRLYAAHADTLDLPVVLRQLLVVLAITAALLLLLKPVLPHGGRRALVVSLFWVAFFHFSLVESFLAPRLPDVLAASRVRILILEAVVVAALIVLVARSRRDFGTLGTYLNLMSLLLLLFNAASLATALRAQKPASWTPVVEQIARPDAGQALQAETKPDIYYIILDGYARSDVLERYYRANNREFLDFLNRRGFYTPGDSHSNYPQTLLSLASSLNMAYLDVLPETLGEKTNNRRPLRYLVQHNKVAGLLRQYGYKYVLVSSGYSVVATTSSPLADVCICRHNGLHESDHALIGLTPLDLLSPLLSRPYASHRGKVDAGLRALERIPAMEGPVFVFAHIVSPHPPFVFGPNGEALEPRHRFSLDDGSHYPGPREEYVRGYRDQLAYLNQRLQHVVETILAQSETEPIIILQSDHGPGSMLEWEDPNSSSAEERLSNFAAYYFPNGGSEQLYPTITPVNTFRILFNHYFGTDYPLLRDTSYLAKWTRPYDFIRIRLGDSTTSTRP